MFYYAALRSTSVWEPGELSSKLSITRTNGKHSGTFDSITIWAGSEEWENCNKVNMYWSLMILIYLARMKIQKMMNPLTPRHRAQWKLVQVHSTFRLLLPRTPTLPSLSLKIFVDIFRRKHILVYLPSNHFWIPEDSELWLNFSMPWVKIEFLALNEKM